MRCDFNTVIGAAAFVLPIKLYAEFWMCEAMAGTELP
jgi:hypothetical protein